MNTKHLLKEPLKIQATYGASSLPVGTAIETTDREAYFGTMKCRVVLADGREHLAYRADIDEAIKPRDFTQGKLGIRVFDNDCFVIEKRPGVEEWVEVGQRFALPLPAGFASVLAMVFKACEIKNPGSGLRELLTKKPLPKGEVNDE